MCGITGFITLGTRAGGVSDRRTYLKQTLMVDSLRGFHGTGVFYEELGANGCGWAKAAEAGFDFVNSKNYGDVERDMHKLRFAVGHNRWATTGASDDVNNTHPFCEGDVTMVHNGTLDGDGGLMTSQIHLDVDVDSHAVCHNLAIHDAVEVIEKLEGAFVLIWHDKRDDSINFVRNGERPLTMFTQSTSTSDTVLFGSERKMMEWIMDRNSISVYNGEYKDLPVGEIWKFLPDSLVPEITKVKLAPVFSGYNNYGYNYNATYDRSNYVPPLNKPLGNKVVNIKPTGGTSHACNKVLNEEGFDRTDRLPFLPTAVVGNMVVGVIENLDQPCFVTGERQTVIANNFDRRWTIKPVGLRRMPDTKTGKTVTVVMAKLTSWHYHDTMWQYGEGWLGNNVEDKIAENMDIVPWDGTAESHRDFAAGNGYFPIGVEGHLVGRTAWFKATHAGCSMCQKVVGTYECDELSWLDDASDSFLCGDCSQKHL